MIGDASARVSACVGHFEGVEGERNRRLGGGYQGRLSCGMQEK